MINNDGNIMNNNCPFTYENGSWAGWELKRKEKEKKISLSVCHNFITSTLESPKKKFKLHFQTCIGALGC